MYKEQRIVALITARGGSKRLPRKNILPIRGIPMIEWSIATARNSTLIDEVIVSTDDDEIARVSEAAGASILERPANLSLDQTPSLPVFQDALQRMRPKADLLVVLMPTNPFRRVEDVDDAIRMVIDRDADALISVTKSKMGPEWMMEIRDGFLEAPESNNFSRTRTQDQLPYYLINGSLYIFRPDTVLSADHYAWGRRTLPMVMETPWDMDIDNLTDLRIANAIADEFDLHC